MVSMKRCDPKMVQDIQAFREKLAIEIKKRTGKQPTTRELIFAQIEQFKATAREHADATFPLFREHELRTKLWTELKRIFNVEGDDTEMILGVPHRYPTIDGKIGQIFFEEISYDKIAVDARKHQDILNKGGKKKSAKLQRIERTPGLKQKHQRKLRALKRAAGID